MLAAPAIGETGVSLNTDAAISRTALRAGRSLIHPVDPSRRQFVYSIGGEVKINGHLLAARDQARISDESSLVIEAVEQADLLLIDVPAAV